MDSTGFITEPSDEPSNSMKCEKFFDQLRDYQSPKSNSVVK